MLSTVSEGTGGAVMLALRIQVQTLTARSQELSVRNRFKLLLEAESCKNRTLNCAQKAGVAWLKTHIRQGT